MCDMTHSQDFAVRVLVHQPLECRLPIAHGKEKYASKNHKKILAPTPRDRDFAVCVLVHLPLKFSLLIAQVNTCVCVGVCA